MRFNGQNVRGAIGQPNAGARQRHLHHLLRKIARWMKHVLMLADDPAERPSFGTPAQGVLPHRKLDFVRDQRPAIRGRVEAERAKLRSLPLFDGCQKAHEIAADALQDRSRKALSAFCDLIENALFNAHAECAFIRSLTRIR